MRENYYLKLCFHWRKLRDNAGDSNSDTWQSLTCLGPLGWCNINRNNPPICVTSPKVAKASAIVAVTCCCRWCNRLKLNAYVNYPLRLVCDVIIDIESLQNRLLKVCYVPTTSASLNRRLFFLYLFLLRPLTVLMNQTRQAVRAIKQSILLRCLWMWAWQWGSFTHKRAWLSLEICG